MKNIEKIHEMYPDMDFLQADGFDEAIVGVEPLSGKLIYNITKMMWVLVDEGLSTEEAMEYLDYNVLNSYVGEQTPIYIQSIEDYDTNND